METKPQDRTVRYYLLTLLLRGAVLALLILWAVRTPERFDAWLSAGLRPTPLTAVWLALMLSMALRLLPSRRESLGCQKEFAARFRPTGRAVPREEIRAADRGALWVLLSWAALNGAFLLAHWRGRLSGRFLVCLAGFYGVCDIVCILFFCPFQAWMMHNRCCTTCRIYNWDYAMLCTPLLALKGPLSLSACALALAVLLRWEWTYRRRRERFFACSNAALDCGACQERLCRYKRALARTVRGSGGDRRGS